MGLSGASQRRCFGALAAGFAALAVDSQTAHMAQGTERLLGDAVDLVIAEAVPGLDSHARGPRTEGGVGGSLSKPVWVFSPQAAELVSKNWEAYKAHMQDVRDYLEARLEVSRPSSFVSPLPGSQPADCGAWSQGGYVPLALPPPHQDRAACEPRVVHSPLISLGLLWEAEDPPQQPLYRLQATLQHL